MVLNIKKILAETNIEPWAKEFIDEFGEGKGVEAHPTAVKHTAHIPFNEHHQLIVEADTGLDSVSKVLTDHGYVQPNFKDGVAHKQITMKAGPFAGQTKLQGKSIARILAEHAPHLVEKFNTRNPDEWHRQYTSGEASSSSYDLVISRHKYDVGGMSTNKKWTSCQTIREESLANERGHPNGYNLRVHGDVKAGSIVAYMLNKSDASEREDKTKPVDVDKSQARITLKPYREVTKPGFDPNESSYTVYRTSSIYGDRQEAFRAQIRIWAEKHFPMKEETTYKQDRRVYNDGESTTLEGPFPKNWKPTEENKPYAISLLERNNVDRDTHDKITKAFPETLLTHGAMLVDKSYHTPESKQELVGRMYSALMNAGPRPDRDADPDAYYAHEQRTTAAARAVVSYSANKEHILDAVGKFPVAMSNIRHNPHIKTEDGIAHILKNLSEVDKDYEYIKDNITAHLLAIAGYQGFKRPFEGMENHPHPAVQDVVVAHGTDEQAEHIIKNSVELTPIQAYFHRHQNSDKAGQHIDSIMERTAAQKPSTAYVLVNGAEWISPIHKQKIYDAATKHLDKMAPKSPDDYDFRPHILDKVARYSTNPEHRDIIINNAHETGNYEHVGTIFRRFYPYHEKDHKPAEELAEKVFHEATATPERAKAFRDRKNYAARLSMIYALPTGSRLLPFFAHMEDHETVVDALSTKQADDGSQFDQLHKAVHPDRKVEFVRYTGFNKNHQTRAYELGRERERLDQKLHDMKQELQHKHADKLAGRQVNESQFDLDGDHEEFIDSYVGRNRAVSEKTKKLTDHLPWNEHHQIVEPLQSERGEIEEHLQSKGWRIHDYNKGLAARDITMKAGPYAGQSKVQTKNIAKIVDNPDLLKKFNSRRIRDDDDDDDTEHHVVYSRHKYDVGGMSTHKNWSSCQNLEDSDLNDEEDSYGEGGLGNLRVHEELQHGTICAYLMKSNDVHNGRSDGAVNTSDAVARIALRPYFSSNGDHAYHNGKIYGDGDETFRGAVGGWIKKNFPLKPNTRYNIHPEVYHETKNTIWGPFDGNFDFSKMPSHEIEDLVFEHADKLTPEAAHTIWDSHKGDTYYNKGRAGSSIHVTLYKQFPKELGDKAWSEVQGNLKDGTHSTLLATVAGHTVNKDHLDVLTKTVHNANTKLALVQNKNINKQQMLDTLGSPKEPDADNNLEHAKWLSIWGEGQGGWIMNNAIATAAKAFNEKDQKEIFDLALQHTSDETRSALSLHGHDEHLDKLIANPDIGYNTMGKILYRGREKDMDAAIDIVAQHKNSAEDDIPYGVPHLVGHIVDQAKSQKHLDRVFDVLHNSALGQNSGAYYQNARNNIAERTANPQHLNFYAHAPNCGLNHSLVRNPNVTQEHLRTLINKPKPEELPETERRANHWVQPELNVHGQDNVYNRAQKDRQYRHHLGSSLRSLIADKADADTLAMLARREPSSWNMSSVMQHAKKFEDNRDSTLMIHRAIASNPSFQAQYKKHQDFLGNKGSYGYNTATDAIVSSLDPSVKQELDTVMKHRDLETRYRNALDTKKAIEAYHSGLLNNPIRMNKAYDR